MQQASRRFPDRVPPLATVLWLGLASTGCRPEPSPPAEPVPQVAPPLGGGTVALERDPFQLFAPDEAAPPAPRLTAPELPFEERSEGLPTSGTWRGYPVLADLDGDGRADLVASNREEDGFGVWLAPAAAGPWKRVIEGLPRDLGYGPAAVCDVDSDGIRDLVLSAHTDALRVYRNDGRQVWTRIEKVDVPSPLLQDLAIGNLDGDGRPDLVCLAQFKGGFFVYSGDGAGAFRHLPEGARILDERVFGRDVELYDLDGDGLDDIVAATNAGTKVFLTKGGEKPSWEEISSGLPRPDIGNSLYAVSVGRFAKGAWPQIAVALVPSPIEAREKRKAIGVYAFDASSRTWSSIDRGLPVADSILDARAADFDGDGELDLATMSPESGALIHLGDGKGGFQTKGRLPGILGKGRFAFGDADGDGRVDIAVSIPATKEHPEQGGLRVFLNRADVWKSP